MVSDGEPVLPDYGGACLSNLLAALEAPGRPAPWLPEPLRTARQVVLLLVDGLGWLQLDRRRASAPALAAMAGGAITSVAPTTTATALASVTLGVPPAAHGVVGYRVHVGEGAVLNVLRWRTADGDARRLVPPERFQPRPAFGGRATPVVTRADFDGSGFSLAHLGGARIRGWREPSAITVDVAGALAEGEPLVYAYYDGLDRVAHDRGFGAYYDAELVHVDRLVADLAAALPTDAALVVTSDHGQVEVGERIVPLPAEVLELTALVSGEGRFAWLHARPGCLAELERRCRRRFEAGGQAWVRTRPALEAEGWLGGPLAPGVAARLGDVALVARQPVAFVDPADSGSAALRCRHGSVTAEEMLVPLLAVGR